MNTNDSLTVKNSRAKKMMLWFGMISLTMSFLAKSANDVNAAEIDLGILTPIMECPYNSLFKITISYPNLLRIV